jgi:protein-S-isoprenylcysteine O-methyltransferase Ste14
VKQSTAWALVGAQFGLLAGLIVLPGGDLWQRGPAAAIFAGLLILLGIALGVVGGLRLGATLTPLPIPKDDGELITGGIYGFIRHPIYSGVLLATLGLVVWGASIAHLIGWGALFVVLMTKATLEEKMLEERYPAYRDYVARTGRLLPRFRRGG